METEELEVEELIDNQEEQRYFIASAWLEENNRSFITIAWYCLCPACSKRLESELEAVTPDSLLGTIKDCCSKAPNFIASKLPILEAIFRLFLANGNQPLSVREIATRLGAYRVGLPPLSHRTLSRLLEKDNHYGIRQFLAE